MSARTLLHSIVVMLVLVGSLSNAHAVPVFFEAWKARYPASNSSSIECQLCHERPEGGDGWNDYGWAIRVLSVDDGFSIGTSFELLEQSNSDFDPDGLNNITEIERSMFPGWVNTNSNTIYLKSGEIKTNQTPPFLEVDPTITTVQSNDEICITVPTQKKTLAVICF